MKPSEVYPHPIRLFVAKISMVAARIVFTSGLITVFVVGGINILEPISDTNVLKPIGQVGILAIGWGIAFGWVWILVCITIRCNACKRRYLWWSMEDTAPTYRKDGSTSGLREFFFPDSLIDRKLLCPHCETLHDIRFG